MQRFQETLALKEQAKHQPKIVQKEVKIDESYKMEPEKDFKDVDVVPGMRELEPIND